MRDMKEQEKRGHQFRGPIVPTFEAFQGLLKTGNLIPVYKEVFADTDTPISLFSKFTDEASFLFENVDASNGQWGRYSYIGLQPSMIIRGRGNGLEIVEANGQATRVLSGDPLELLEAELKKIEPVLLPDLPDFTGGFVGYLSYDSVRWFEKIPKGDKPGLDMPELFFLRADTLLIHDRLKGSVIIVENVDVKGKDLEQEYRRAAGNLDRIAEKLKTTIAASPKKSREKPAEKPVESSFGDKSSFMAAVDLAKQHIYAGDVVQVVLSQRFERECNAEAFDIYRALRLINPSPYMFFLDTGEGKVVGASPEILVQVKGGNICLKPIAGTRRRGETEPEDRQIEKELLNDPKEVAEHMMLVDLGRNDVGKVAKAGSVDVSELMSVEKYSHVMHMVSTVKGKLKPEKTSFDVFRSCFPAGTVTGAPKIRAMEIIEALEPIHRGPYAGAVGTIGFSGNMNFCIAIRTLVQKGNRVYFQAGAGIVADSNPEHEYQETLDKASGVLKSIEYAEREISPCC